MSLPTVTIDELSKGIQTYSSTKSINSVLEGILNDYMDLQYGKETPYTTGKQVIPSGATLDDVKNGIENSELEKKYKDLFVTINEVYQSGDLTPRSKNDGWDDKLKPVLVLVTANP